MAAEASQQELQKILVDLTPVVPGGDNGGAKVFVLELLRRLGELAPQTQFVLLTQAAAHDELATLDSHNISRVVALDVSKANVRGLATRIYSRIVRHLPARIRNRAARVGYRLLSALKQSGNKSMMRNQNADLLFCPFTAPTYFDPRVPTVCVIYDLQYRTYPQFFSPEDVTGRHRSFMDAARRATRLIAISEYSRQKAIETAELAPERISAIHLHVSQHSLRSAARDETVLKRLGLTPRRFIIYPANFWEHKNHQMLLTAFGIARRQGLGEDVRLVCTGAPGERQRLMAEAAAGMGLGDRVLFPGYVTHAELTALITESAGLVFPSLYEGFGLPVVEAMAVGVPVACSNLTSLPEVAGDAALLFDPRKPEEIAAAIVTLAEDTQRRQQLIEAGTERAARFSDSTLLARQYWDVFNEAIGAERTTDLLTGVTPDGWIGPNLSVHFATADQARTLDLELTLPVWVPVPRLMLQWRLSGGGKGSMTLERGSSQALSIQIPPATRFCEVTFGGAFVPAQMGLGDDERELSAQLMKCTIESAGEARVVLFPEMAAS